MPSPHVGTCMPVCAALQGIICRLSTLSPLINYVRKSNSKGAPHRQCRGPVLAGVVGDAVCMQGVVGHKRPCQEGYCTQKEMHPSKLLSQSWRRVQTSGQHDRTVYDSRCHPCNKASRSARGHPTTLADNFRHVTCMASPSCISGRTRSVLRKTANVVSSGHGCEQQPCVPLNVDFCW
jgi:hypothetical protein